MADEGDILTDLNMDPNAKPNGADNRPAAFEGLKRLLEAAGLLMRFSSMSVSDGELIAVFGTDDDGKAEDVLRDYLILPDAGASEEYT